MATIGGANAIERLTDEILTEFDIDRETCQQDVALFLASLAEQGLVEFL